MPQFRLRLTRGSRICGRALALLLVAVASFAATLFAVDALLVRQGVLFDPMRSRANVDEVLTRSEFTTHVRTNSLGFRETRPPAAPPAGTMRIVAIGDAFTQGYGVAEEGGFTRRLEDVLRRRWQKDVDVINLGVPGACPPDYLYHLRNVGLDYEPDIVLVGVMANDVIELRSLERNGARDVIETLRQIRVRRLDERPMWKRAPQRLWPALYDLAAASVARVPASEADPSSHPAAAPRATSRDAIAPTHWRDVLLELADRYGRGKEVRAELERMTVAERDVLRDVVTGEWRYEEHADQAPLWRLLSLIEPRAYVDAVLLPPTYDAAWSNMTNVLREIADTARNAGARPIIVFMPAAQQVVPEVRASLERNGFAWDDRVLTDTTFADRLRAFGAATDVPVIDLLEPLRHAPATRALYYPEDRHWTLEGNALAAQIVAAEVPLS